MPTVISRQSSGYRPLFLVEREVASFNFYQNGGVVLRIDRGWFEREGKEVEYRHKDVQRIDVQSTVRRSTKLNFGKGGHFYINSNKDALMRKVRAVDVYFDLSLSDFVVGQEFDMLMYADISGETYQKGRKLTGNFDGIVETIDIAIPGTCFARHNVFGNAIEAIYTYAAEKGIKAPGIMDIINDPKLRELVNAAADVNSKQHQAKPSVTLVEDAA